MKKLGPIARMRYCITPSFHNFTKFPCRFPPLAQRFGNQNISGLVDS